MNNWKKCKLGDIGKVITGKTPSAKNPEDWGNDMCFITPTDYKDYRKIASSSIRKLSNIGIERLKNKILPPKSIMVTCIGSDMGKVAVNKNPSITNQQINSIIPYEKVADADFVYYLLVSMYDTLRTYGLDGTAVPILNKSDFETIEILLPPLEEQRQIAAILSSIDDKIELLHEQNKTLEELAQTFFVNWFKDREFDSTIGDFISIQNGFAFKSKDFIDCGDNGVIKIKNISNGIVDIVNTDKISQEITNEVNDKFKINSGDILFAMTGAEIGKMGIVPNTNKKLWLNQRVGIAKERFLGARFLAYIHLTSEFGYDYVINSATGSAQENISATDIENCPFVKLTGEEIVSYSKQLNDFFEKIIFNLGEIQTLENMRDILIPKLLNGEIKVGGNQ
ncbi:TPA: restriction endonuclease subunit S [Campylobacter coli]|nr:restriction endonuclease subunit S [Campylobacter coli]